MRRLQAGSVVACVAALIMASCGGPGVSPSPAPGGGSGLTTAPTNSPPVIDAITIQGGSPGQAPAFADLGEEVPITATVRDLETPVNQLQYAWSATAGSFSGSGAAVVWRAPSSAATPLEVTISLAVTEAYGNPGGPLSFVQTVRRTASLSLHDSTKEVGDMAAQFLRDFSDSNLRDIDYVMRNFARARCPQPQEVDSEFSDVEKNRRERRITSSSVGSSSTSVKFGGICPFRSKRGDACAVVPVFWADVDVATNAPSSTRGYDIVAAAYSSVDSRWWLCASDYQALSSVGKPFSFSR